MLRKRLERLRRDILVPKLFVILDLGAGVLDAAIDIAGYVFDKEPILWLVAVSNG
jgi:hypothetical protein